VGAGQPIIQIGNLSDLEVEIVLTESEIVDIEVGDNAEIVVYANPTVEIIGKIKSVFPMDLDSNDGRYIVRLSLDEMPDSIYWGMVAEVSISREENSNSDS
jgi:multidrug resistance efflux pump